MYQSFLEYRSAYTEAAFAATTPNSERLAERLAEGPMWVALNDGVLVGTVAAVSLGAELYVRGMAVAPTSRGLGIAAQLLEAVETFALTDGYQRLRLSTTPFLTRAIEFYERSGFKRIPEGPHNLFGTPLFTMVKELKEGE